MKTKFFLCMTLAALLIGRRNCHAQNYNSDSLIRIIHLAKGDTNNLNAYIILGGKLSRRNPDSALLLLNKALSIAESLPDEIPEEITEDDSVYVLKVPFKTKKLAIINYRLGGVMEGKNDYRAALGYLIKALVLSEKTGNEKLRCGTLGDIGLSYWNLSDYPKALDYEQQAVKLAESIGNKKEISRLAGNLGILYADQGNYNKALDYYNRTMDMFVALKDKAGILRTLNNMGVVFCDKGDYLKALDYDFKAIKLEEELKDQEGLARTQGNISVVYMSQKKYSEGLDFGFKALKLVQALGNKYEIARILGIIGTAYNGLGESMKALNYNLWALHIRKDLRDKKGLATGYAAVGDIYMAQGDSAFAKGSKEYALRVKYPNALTYYEKALKLSKELGYKSDFSSWLGDIAAIQITQGKYEDAEKNLLRALALADSIGALDTQKQHHKLLSELYAKKKMFDKSLVHFQKYSAAKDSVANIDNTLEAGKKAMAFEYEKKAALMKAEQERKDAVIAGSRLRQRIIIYFISSVLLLVLCLGALIYRGSLQKQKANTQLEKKNKIIEHQKELVEEKNRHITDSIQYAKRIQEAILPSRLFEAGEVKDYFIYYAPKDIVSGDFYWRFKDGDDLFFAVVDCTGHGVPGAMMSMLGYDMLEYALKDKGLRQPGLILQTINNEIIAKLAKNSNSGSTDGMDITLCKFNVKASILTYAGARNGICIACAEEVRTFPVDKRSIGDEEGYPFREYTISLLANDTVYLFTDGFADQKGGPQCRKFMLGRFHLLLKEISALPCDEQKKKLNDEFQNWKGKESQRDDVLIVGIKLPSNPRLHGVVENSKRIVAAG